VEVGARIVAGDTLGALETSLGVIPAGRVLRAVGKGVKRARRARKAARAAEAAEDAVARAGKKPIVIGENMKDRVVPKAKEIGGDYYKPRPPRDMEHALQKQKRWINDKMREGREIVDMGPDPARRTRSPFYEVEKSELSRRGYPTRSE
jgi:hypothetical protein